MAIRKLIPEIFDEVFKAKTDEDKAAIIRENNTLCLRQIFLYTYDPTVVWDVEIPTYKPDPYPIGKNVNSLFVEFRRLYIFTKLYPNMTQKRKLNILLQILESINKDEAIVLEHVFQHDLTKWGITPQVVNMAFPNLLNIAEIPEPEKKKRAPRKKKAEVNA